MVFTAVTMMASKGNEMQKKKKKNEHQPCLSLLSFFACFVNIIPKYLFFLFRVIFPFSFLVASFHKYYHFRR